MRYRLNWLKVGKTRVLLTCEGGALAELKPKAVVSAPLRFVLRLEGGRTRG